MITMNPSTTTIVASTALIIVSVFSIVDASVAVPGFVIHGPPAKQSVFYNAEHHELYNQKLRPVGGSPMEAIYGLLPAGTEGSIDDHEIKAVVIGDSFASPLAGVFNDIAVDRNVKFTLTSMPSCAAAFDKVSMDHTIRDWPRALDGKQEVVDCKRIRRKEMLELATHSKAKVVFVAANWLANLQLWKSVKSGGVEDPVSEGLRILNRTGKKIVIFGTFPGAHFNVRQCMAGETDVKVEDCPKQSRIAPPFEGEPAMQKKMEQRMTVRKELARILSKPENANLGIEFIDPLRSMCPTADSCLVELNGEPLYSDAMHLTANGGRLLRKDIEAALDKYS